MRMKLRIDNINLKHVHLSVLSDKSNRNNGMLARLDKLPMTLSEYQGYGPVLSSGSGQMQNGQERRQ